MPSRPTWFAPSPKPRSRPVVRPWALAGPVIILLICTPLLRPLRSPGVMSAREGVALESARQLLLTHHLGLDVSRAYPAEAVVGINGKLVSRDAPMFVVLLATAAWLMGRAGVTFQSNPHLLDYLLTLVIATVPTALACGSVYRLARTFELTRPWRLALALATVLATGWVSFAVVLLPNALAVSLVVAAMTAFVQAARSHGRRQGAGWLIVAGVAAGAAATLEPLAIWSAVVVIFGAPFTVKRRVLLAGSFATSTGDSSGASPGKSFGRALGTSLGAMLLVLIGFSIPATAYVLLNRAAAGDLLPPRWHTVVFTGPGPTVVPIVGDDTDPVDVSIWVIVGRAINRLLIYTVGSHGVFSHFPVLLIAIAGAASVLRRHWAGSLKWLAGGMLAALGLLLIYKTVVRVDEVDLDFAAPRLMVIVPPIMIWAGGWVRRSHAPAAWAAAGVALAASVAISMLGATAPAPPGGYTHYTAAEAATRLMSKPASVAEHR